MYSIIVIFTIETTKYLLTFQMDCAAVDCTPDKVLEEMGLKRKGDLYA